MIAFYGNIDIVAFLRIPEGQEGGGGGGGGFEILTSPAKETPELLGDHDDQSYRYQISGLCRQTALKRLHIHTHKCSTLIIHSDICSHYISYPLNISVTMATTNAFY